MMRSRRLSRLLSLLLVALSCLAVTATPRAVAADNDAAILLSLHEWPVAAVRRVRMLRCLRDPASGLAACDLSIGERGRQIKLLRFGEGPGVALGPGQHLFHPGAVASGGYDSNLFAAETMVKGAGFLELGGHLHLGQDAPAAQDQVVRFELHAALRYREYFSDADSVTRMRAVELFAGAGMTLFPHGPVTVTLHNDFARLSAHPDNGLSAQLDWDRNRTTALLSVAPGLGGLVLELEYALTLSLVEESAYAWFNQLQHAITFSGRLPVGLQGMALTLNARQAFINRLDPAGGAGAFRPPYFTGVSPLRLTAGFVGPFGAAGTLAGRFYLLAEVGYGNSLSDAPPSFSNLVGTLELGHRAGPLDWARVGFNRDFQASSWGVTTDHAVYAAYDRLIGRAQLGASFAFQNTVTDVSAQPYATLQHNRARLHLGFDWRFTPWLYAGLHYDLALVVAVDAPMAMASSREHTRHVLLGRVGASY